MEDVAMYQPPEFHICRNRRDDHFSADTSASTPGIVAVVMSVCRGANKKASGAPQRNIIGYHPERAMTAERSANGQTASGVR
jgi:hypothetical protein